MTTKQAKDALKVLQELDGALTFADLMKSIRM